jgi:two-component system CheB/CheR fusion protein
MKVQPGDKTSSTGIVKSTNQFPVIGIGASAGGLDAFKRLLKAIPENSGMAYVLVQHLDPKHESMLPELLQKVTPIPVMEITDDIKVMPDNIYIIPSNKMLIANDGILVLKPRAAKIKNERNLPIDLFFTSLAEVHQSHAIGVVLSGTASDGTLGLKAIKDHGGITFAQDEASAAYEGMPHNAAQAGVVDFILSPEAIPKKLLEITRITHSAGQSEEYIPSEDADIFKQILALLRIRKGTDFTHYKQTTIRRRILRRIALNKDVEPATYLKYLRENKSEQDVLYQDLLIPVTGFFRDPKTFDHLIEKVFTHLIKTKNNGEAIRIWVAGCSTGEEAYSMAICFKELMGKDTITFTTDRVQIFATDVSEPAITRARGGLYSKSNVEGLSAVRLQNYFTKSEAGYLVNRSIREMCVFAVHNFLKDPPFSKMDFISCRNVLIYMEPYLQKKALHIFHYSLSVKGFLLLGKSETTSGTPELFELIDKSDKLFMRKEVPAKFMHTTSLRSEQNYAEMNSNPKNPPIKADFQKTADDIILSTYSPPGVVVNEAMDIVLFRGNTGNYLQQSPGKPSHNLFKMAKEGLAFELRSILHKTKKDHVAVIKENIPVQINGVQHLVTIEALLLPHTIEPHYLVLFHDMSSKSKGHAPGVHKRGSPAPGRKDDKDLRIIQLEKELALVREDMRSIAEDQDAANEELQSSNEELLSGSEELQSLNEELETGKEELQSTNEELMVVNQEMINLNEQITTSRDYAEAIIMNIREPLLVMDQFLRIKTANESFYQTFRVTEKETEGVLIYDLGNNQWDIPSLRTLLEKILPEKSIFNDFEVTHTFSSIGQRVMLLNAREVVNKNNLEKLILLSIEDITEHVIARKKLEQSELNYVNLVQNLPIAVYTCDRNGYINLFNEEAVRLWGKTPRIGIDLWCGSWKLFHKDGSILTHEQCPMAMTIKDGHLQPGAEIIIGREDGTAANVIVHPQPTFDENGILTGGVNTLIDITEIRKAQKALKEAELELYHEIERSQREKTVDLEKKLERTSTDLRFASASILLKDKEIDLNNYNKRFLTAFSERFSDYKQDKEYFNSLTQFIIETTHVDYAYIGKMVQNEQGELVVETIAYNALGKLSPGMSFPLSESPDEQIIRGVIYSYPERCMQIFKQHKVVQDLRIEGFIGYPLNDDQGNAIGLIAVMHRNIIEEAEMIASILKLVARRSEIVFERIENEAQLLSFNEKLKDKNSELIKINKELEAFTYVSSHDLQEPLRKIQTFADRILEKEHGHLSDSGKDYFRRMQSAAIRMQSLIEDLLAFTRISTAERKFGFVEINSVLTDLKAEFREVIEEKNALIESHDLGSVWVIPFQFRQLLYNLLGNALKFSKPGIPPHIIIKYNIVDGSTLLTPHANKKSNYYNISIEDHGIGFEPEYQHKIFEVFQKLHGKEQYPGTGIGLAIVKKIIENHNGLILANGKLNNGAIFDVYLPFP